MTAQTDQKTIQKVQVDLGRFNVLQGKIKELREKCDGYNIKDVDDREGYNNVDKARKSVKSHRVEVEKLRKEMKAPILAQGQQIDDAAKIIICELQEIEDKQKKKLEYIDAKKEKIRQEQIRIQNERISSRTDRLNKIGMSFDGHAWSISFDEEYCKITDDDIRTMPDDEFEVEFHKAKKISDTIRLDEEVKRVNREKEEAAEKERLRIQQEKRDVELKAQREEQEKIRKQQAEEAEKLRLENERIAKEKAELEQEQARIAEENARLEQLKKEEAARIEAERIAKEQEELRKKALPEKEKLIELMKIEVPKTMLQSELAAQIYSNFVSDLHDLCNRYIDTVHSKIN